MSNRRNISKSVFQEDATESGIQSFRAVLETYILPLFHYASIEGPKELAEEPSGPAGATHAKSVELRVPGHPRACYSLKREVAFTAQERSFLNDVGETLRKETPKPPKYSHSSLCDIIERAIARQLNPDCADTILRILQVYTQWAAETYEGRRIAHTIGICGKAASETGHSFHELRNNNALKSLAASPESILIIDKSGMIIGVEAISAKQANYRKNNDVLAPIDMAHVALWTNSSGRIAFRLSANGEILIFVDRQLAYAKRRSYWRRFPSKSLFYEQFSVPYSTAEETSKRATYLTALDLAFSGKGGCLGLLQTSDPSADAHKLVNENMLFASDSPSSTVRLLVGIANRKKFAEIPRRVRLGFCALDGATLIDAQGTLLAAGAILRTNGNPLQGGGRTAAAQTLGGYGLGIKISADGFIEIHRGDLPPLLFA